MLTSFRDPQTTTNGLTKRSGQAASHHVSWTAKPRSELGARRSKGTPISPLRPRSLRKSFPAQPPSSVRHRKAQRRPAFHGVSRRRPLRRVAKFRFDTRCQTDPAASRAPRLAQQLPQLLGTFFPTSALAPLRNYQVRNVTLPTECDGRATRLSPLPISFVFCFWYGRGVCR